jgi:molybdate transport system substrate-binding protein
MRKSLQPLASCLVITIFVLTACQPARSSTGSQLTIFAASSLTDAFNDLSAAFKAANPGVDVVLNYGASSQLATQIKQGGEADVFAPASQSTFKTVADAGHIDAGPAIFATNRLTIITPADNPAKITGLADLAKPGSKLVLAVKGVPIRDYADQIFANAAADPSFGTGFPTQVHANLVSEEDNVRLVVSKVALGEADAGICYVTDITQDVTTKIAQIDIPDNLNVIATYPIGTIKGSRQPGLAKSFVDFVLSSAGQAILAKWGFGPGK